MEKHSRLGEWATHQISESKLNFRTAESKFFNRSKVSPFMNEQIFHRPEKAKKIKKTTLTQKKIQFSHNQANHRLRNIRQIFHSLLRDIRYEETNNRSVAIPKQLINTLYRQNIKNYNPYIATLEQLEQEKSLCVAQRQKIGNLCHIGMAKAFLKTKKYSQGPRYSRVNVLIRTYMRDKMCEEVKIREQNNDSVIFIPTSQLALSFSPTHYPKGIEDVLPLNHYSSIIAEVNRIIETEYVQYKSSNTFSSRESLFGKLILGVLAILIIVFCWNQNHFLLPFVLVLLLAWIAHSVHEGRNTLQKLVQSKNVTLTIQQKIAAFFEQIRTDRIEWKVGQDFYWLQIHYIKKKKRYHAH